MFGSKFFSWDKAMQCPETGEPAVINTSEICEELGQIQYLFTDKTGTITENKFQLRHCSIEGQRYTLKDGDIFCHINDITGEEEEVDAASQEQIIKFLRVGQIDINSNPDFLRYVCLNQEVLFTLDSELGDSTLPHSSPRAIQKAAACGR